MDPIFRCETCGIAYTVREGYSLKNEPRTQTRCAHHPFDCFYLNAAGKWKCPADGCANNCIECGRLQAEFERLRWEHQLTRARLNAADLSDPGLEGLRTAVEQAEVQKQKAQQAKKLHQATCVEKV
jgi:hypothetical protein